MPRITEHLIVISFDALATPDFGQVKTLPNFKVFLEAGTHCKNVTSVYPTLTYPAHTSIVTGRYPKDHGIVNNTMLQPQRESPDWYWQRRYIKGETLYDRAIDQGLKVASLLWPVTGKSRIQYNMPEIFANRAWQNQILVSLFNGSPLYQWKLNRRFGHLRNGLAQPELDHFVHRSLLYTLSEYKPDLTLVHFTDLDAQKHRYGCDSSQAHEAIKRYDQKLGEIVQLLREKDMYEKSTIVVLGDHGALNEDKVIYLNTLLARHGLIKTVNGRIKSWQAIMKNCDGSCYIYLKDRNDQALKQTLAGILEELQKGTGNGIEAVYSAEEARALGADPECAFMVEAREGYYFKDGIHHDLIKTIEEEDRKKGFTAATHGYSPFKPGYTTLFMAAGRGISKGQAIDGMALIDEGPLLAYLLGLKLEQAERGNSLEKFNEKRAELGIL